MNTITSAPTKIQTALLYLGFYLPQTWIHQKDEQDIHVKKAQFFYPLQPCSHLTMCAALSQPNKVDFSHDLWQVGINKPGSKVWTLTSTFIHTNLLTNCNGIWPLNASGHKEFAINTIHSCFFNYCWFTPVCPIHIP